jgi:ADP-ribose pyrophosphatase YjhB (NUDIX family)
MPSTLPRWLDWVQRLQAVAQTGLAYGKDPFDIERFQQVQAIAAEIAAAHTDTLPDTINDLFAGEIGHATPKVDVRGVVFRDDTLLLVRERSDGRWTLPGGWVDIGESPSEAVTREVKEESGYDTRAVKLLALYDRSRHDHPAHIWYIYKLFFQCDLLGGEPVPDKEILEVGFFRPDALPELSAGRVTAKQIARFFEHRQHPDWPTEFD